MDTSQSPGKTLELLRAWTSGDADARERVIAELYDDLHRVAHAHMRGERPGHLFQTTALVHEAYLRLAGLTSIEWRDRAHFLAMAATVMRRILVDEARRRRRDKRGGGVRLTSLHGDLAAATPDLDVLLLDDALERLAALDVRQARVVEMRFFGGLSNEEIAEVLDTSPATVKRDWATAKLWLYRALAAS